MSGWANHIEPVKGTRRVIRYCADYPLSAPKLQIFLGVGAWDSLEALEGMDRPGAIWRKPRGSSDVCAALRLRSTRDHAGWQEHGRRGFAD